LHSLIRTFPFRWLLSTGHVLIWTFAIDDSNCSFRWLFSTVHVLISTFAFADSNCSISVSTEHRTRAHMDFCIRWFELLHFGEYSELDTCLYGLLDTLIRTAPFRRLLSPGHVLIWTFAFAASNCFISVTTQHWTRAHIDFCIRWFELHHFGDYSALDTCSYGLFAFADSNCSISVTTQHWTNAHMDFYIRWFELLHFGEYSALDTCSYGLLHSLI
jgi:hypothetical protein